MDELRFGHQGDDTGLYTWLDGLGAKECTDSTAFFTLDLDGDEDGFAMLRGELEEAAELSARARIYVCGVRGRHRTRAGFVVGRRKRALWQGYAASDDSEDDVSDENDR